LICITSNKNGGTPFPKSSNAFKEKCTPYFNRFKKNDVSDFKQKQKQKPFCQSKIKGKNLFSGNKSKTPKTFSSKTSKPPQFLFSVAERMKAKIELFQKKMLFL